MRPVGETFRRYHALSSTRAALDLALHWGALLALFAAAHVAQHPLVYLGAMVAIAGLQNALASLAHEAWHNKTFTSRALNDAVGAWLYAYPIGLPFHHDRRRHLQHHQRVGSAADPDWPNYDGPSFETRRQVAVFLLGKLVGLHLVTALWHALVHGRPRIDLGDEEDTVSTRRELAAVFAVQLLLFAGFAVFAHWWEYVLLWLVPLATFAAFFVSARAFLEHTHPDPAPEPEERLYDFDTNAVGHFLLSPCHFHLHALHHAYPGIPHYRLPAAKRALCEGATLSYPGRQRPGYLGALREHFAAMEAREAGVASGSTR